MPPTPLDEALAAELPPRLRLGTSSWAFPGWEGIVYDGHFSQRSLSGEGLRAYAQHPLLRTVGVDRAHYAPLTAAQWREHAEQVPPDFRFLVKAHEACTLRRFPGHARYGARRGQDNPDFLDPFYAREVVIEPMRAGLGASLGVLLFQFAAQPLDALGGPRGFARGLFRFLNALPPEVPVAIEVRNPQLLTPEYRDTLAEVGAVHCLNAIGGMPDLATQARLTGALRGRALVVRWMLRRELDYEGALDRYQPFDRLVDPDPGTREAIAELVDQVGARPGFLIINNKAEGCSPLSVRELARAIVGRVRSRTVPRGTADLSIDIE